MTRPLSFTRRALLAALTVVAMLATFAVAASPASAEVAPPGALSTSATYVNTWVTVNVGELECQGSGSAPWMRLYVGATNISVVVAGQGDVTFMPGPAGVHEVRAVVEPGSGDCDGVTVEYGTLTVYSRTTVSTLTAASAPFYADKPVTFQASVAGPMPDGEVPTGNFTFFVDGGAVTAPVPVNTEGVASATVTLPTIGSKAVTAVFDGGGVWQSSTGALTHVVAPEPLTFSDPTGATRPAYYNSSMTASITSTYGDLASYDHTGITATVNGDTVPITQLDGLYMGTWGHPHVFSMLFWMQPGELPVGSHPATLTIPAQGNFAAAVVEFDLVVTPHSTTMAATGPGTATTWGTPFNVSVSVPGVTSVPVDGTVNVFDADDRLVGTSGYRPDHRWNQAPVQVSGLPVGDDQVLLVELTGSTRYSDVSATTTVSVDPSPGAVDIAVAGDGLAGVPTSVDVHVSHTGGTAPGSVELFADDASLGTATVDSNGDATFAFTPPADLVTFDAVFTSADSNYASTDGSTDLAFTAVNTSIEFDATYTEPAAPDTTGAISGSMCVTPEAAGFDPALLADAEVETSLTFDGTQTQSDTVPLEELDDCWGLPLGGENLTPGGYTIEVTFAGNEYLAAGTNSWTFTVLEAPTELALAVTDPGETFGLTTEFTATLSAPVPGVTQTGEISFYVNGTHATTATVENGTATFSTQLGAGSATVTATYSGDGVHGSALSPAVVVDVAQASATVTVSVNPDPVRAGEHATLTADVTVNDPAPSTFGFGSPLASAAAATPVATGTVTFFVNGTPVGTATLTGGTASLPYVFTAGSHTVTASYSGDADVAPVAAAASDAAAVTVAAAPTPPGAPTPPVAPTPPSAIPPAGIVVPQLPAPAPVGVNAAAAAGTDSLPRTGSSTAILVLIGSALLAAGVVLTGRRSSRD